MSKTELSLKICVRPKISWLPYYSWQLSQCR